MIRLRSFVCTIAVALAPAWGQQFRQPGAEFSADSKLVVVPVTVIDRHGAFTTGLPQDAFTVLENGVAQRIASFSEDDSPVSLGIVLDLSGSMKGLLDVARESFRHFASLSNPEDEAFLNVVSTQPREWSGFTEDIDGLFRSVASQDAQGKTALVDTVWLSLTQLRASHNARKALLVISDGMDNQSRHTRRELLDRAVETDAQIYTVSTYQPLVSARAMARGIPAVSLDQQSGLELMHDLAAKTGGLQFTVRTQAEIGPAIQAISQALRNEYNLGYVPADRSRTGQWRRIQVRIARSGLHAYTRTGYRAD
jgi:Ca-activated chloride channel family protein